VKELEVRMEELGVGKRVRSEGVKRERVGAA
jgi:hypothetical protein